MRYDRIKRVCTVGILGLVAMLRVGFAQSQSSAVIHATAEVVDVGTLRVLPADHDTPAADATMSGAMPPRGVSPQGFSVNPPRFSVVGVSMHVDGVSAAERSGMAVQVCRRSGASRSCGRIPLAGSLDGTQTVAVTDEAVSVRLLGLAEVALDGVRVTVTLAYLGA